ncbi:MAG: HAD family hydrolase [Bacteroidota bacterium]
MSLSDLNISRIKAVVFDLDGTLYDLKKVQQKMRFKIIRFLLRKPWKWKEIYAVYVFRKQRKKLAGQSVANLREVEFAYVAQKVGLGIDQVERSIEHWMEEVPLPYVSVAAYEHAQELIHSLAKKGIPFAILSDLPTEKKVQSLGISCEYCFSAEQKEIEALKPNPKALELIAQHLGLRGEDILCLGDRKELDGKMAKAAGAQFIFIPSLHAEEKYQEVIRFFE